MPGPDLDHYLCEAAQGRDLETCLQKPAELAQLLAFFHSRPLPLQPVSPEPALAYLEKLRHSLAPGAVVPGGRGHAGAKKAEAWEVRLAAYTDRQVLMHGDATPTNFLFPDGRAVALDLERLRVGDRLWDLSWVAGELKHAWGWRSRDFGASEAAIECFFRIYLAALPADPDLTRESLP